MYLKNSGDVDWIKKASGMLLWVSYLLLFLSTMVLTAAIEETVETRAAGTIHEIKQSQDQM